MDPQPWIAEQVVAPDVARALVRRQFGLRADTVELAGEGWDNTAYLVDREWIVRFPRRQIAVQLLKTEVAALPRIAGALPVRIPMPELVGAPCDEFGWPFAGYRRIPGRSICQSRLGPEERRRLAAPLGELLAALHGLDPLPIELPGDRFAKLDVERLHKQLSAQLPRASDRGLLDRALREAVEASLEAPVPPAAGPARVAHGDLYCRHLLIDDGGNLSGVIDWGDVHANDPAVDLMAVLMVLPPADRPLALRAYGDVPPERWALARLRGTFHAVETLLYAADIGDAALLEESRASLAHLTQGGALPWAPDFGP